MGNQTELSITLTGTNELSQVLNDVSGDLQGLGKTVSDTDATVGGFGDHLKSFGSAVTSSLAAVLPVLAGMATGAAKVEGVRDALDSMAQEIGSSADEIVASMRKATAGTVSEADIMSSAVRALSLIGKDAFGDFGSEFASASDLVRRAARATGQDVSFLMDSLVLGVGRSSKMILDNLGIMVDITGAQETYAKSLGKTKDQLTDAEAKAAVWNATLAALKEKYGAVAASSGGLNQSSQQLGAMMADLRQEIGRAFIPVMAKLTEAMAGVIGVVQKIVPYLEIMFREVAKLPAPLLAAAAAVISLAGGAGMLAPVLAFLPGPIAEIGLKLAGLAGPIGLAITAIALLSVAWRKDFLGIQGITSKAAGKVKTALNNISSRVKEFTSEFKHGFAVSGDAALALGEALDNFLPSGVMDQIWGLLEAVSQIGQVVLDAAKQIKGVLQKALKDVGKALKAGNLVGAIKILFKTVKKIFELEGKALGKIAAKWGPPLLAWIKAVTPKMISALKVLGKAVLSWIQSQAQSLRDTIRGKWVPAFSTWISQVSSTLASKLPTILRSVTSWASRAVSSIRSALSPWVGAALAWIGTVASSIASKLPDILRSVTSWASRAVSSIKSALSPWVDAALDWIGEVASSIATKLPDILKSITSWASKAVSSIKKALSPWVDASVEWIGKAASTIASKLPDILKSVTSWTSKAVSSIKKALLPWVDATTEWIGKTASSIGSKLPDILKSILAWAKGAASSIKQALSPWVEAFLGWVGEAASKIAHELPKILDAIGDWLASKVPELAAKILNMFSSAIGKVNWNTVGSLVAQAFFAALAAIGAAAYGALKIIQIIVKGIVSLATSAEFRSAAIGIAGALLRAILGFAKGFVDTAFSIVGILVSSIVSRISADDMITSLGGGILESISSAISSIAESVSDSAHALANSIIDGIKGGLEAGEEALHAAIDTVIGKLPGWARRLLGAESPSKVFAEIGIDIVKGLAAGLSQGEATILSAVADLVGNISQAFEAAFSAAQTLAGGVPTVAGGTLIGLGAFAQQLIDQAIELSAQFRLAGNFLDERLVKAINATSDVIRNVAGSLESSVNLIHTLFDFQTWASGIEDLQVQATAAVETIVNALDASVGAIVDHFQGWSDKDIVGAFVDPAIQAVVQSWVDMLDVVASSADTIRTLIDAGKWTEGFREIQSRTQQGMNNILAALDSAVQSLQRGILSWSPDQVKAQTIDPAITAMVQSWADMLGAIAGSGDDILSLVDIGAWTISFRALDAGIRRGIANVFQGASSMLDSLRLGILSWSPEQVEAGTIDSAVVAMVQSWADMLGAIASSGDDILGLVDIGAWTISFRELDRGIRRGIANVFQSITSMLNVLSTGILSWSAEKVKAQTIDPLITAMVQSWADMLGAISGAIDSIEALFQFATWSVDQEGIESKVHQAANDLIRIAGDIAQIWADAGIEVTQAEGDAAANLSNIIGVLGGLVDVIQSATGIDVNAFTSTIQRKLVDSLKAIALAVDDAVFGPDGLVAQKATILDDLQKAAVALAPLGDAVRSAVDAISAVVDLGKVGLVDVRTGNLTVQVDKFREYFETGLGRLQKALQSIAAILVAISTDTAITSGLTAAAGITEGLGALATATGDIQAAIQHVFDVGSLGTAEGAPNYGKAIRDGINRIQGFLDQLVAVINGVTVPAVDLTWLVDLLNLLASVASGGAPESSAAFDALEQAGETLTAILQKIVDIASGEGMGDVDTTWLAELFKLLRSLIEAQDFSDAAKSAAGSVGAGLDAGFKDLINDPSWKLQATTTIESIRDWVDKELAAQAGTFFLKPLISISAGVVDIGDTFKSDVIAAIQNAAAAIQAVTVAPPLSVGSPGAAGITIAGAVLTAIGDKITSMTAAAKPVLNVASPGLAGISIDQSVVMDIGTKITDSLPVLNTKPLGITIMSPGLTNLTVDGGIGTDIGTKLANYSFSASAKPDIRVYSPGLSHITVDSGVATAIEDRIAGITSAHVELTRLYVDKGVGLDVTINNYTDFLSAITAAFGSAYWGPSVKIDAINTSKAPGMSVSIGAGIASTVAQEIQDAVNAELGSSLSLTKIHVKDIGFDSYFPGTITDFATAVQYIIQHGLDATLGKSIDLGEKTLDMDLTYTPFDLLAEGVGRLADAIREFRFGELAALQADLVALPALGLIGGASAASLPAMTGRGSSSGDVHYHAHLNVDSTRMPEDLLTDFNVLWSIASA